MRLLNFLADSRQAKVTDSTYKTYIPILMRFYAIDLRDAVETLALRERRDGETAFPSLATVVSLTKGIAGRRQARNAQETMSAERRHYLEHPERYCSMLEIWQGVEELRQRRRAGEVIPTQERQWTQDDTNRYLARIRQPKTYNSRETQHDRAELHIRRVRDDGVHRGL
jgi:hypothetical protein